MALQLHGDVSRLGQDELNGLVDTLVCHVKDIFFNKVISVTLDNGEVYEIEANTSTYKPLGSGKYSITLSPFITITDAVDGSDKIFRNLVRSVRLLPDAFVLDTNSVAVIVPSQDSDLDYILGRINRTQLKDFSQEVTLDNGQEAIVIDLKGVAEVDPLQK